MQNNIVIILDELSPFPDTVTYLTLISKRHVLSLSYFVNKISLNESQDLLCDSFST